MLRPEGNTGWASLRTLLAGAWALGACATTGMPTGSPLGDPEPAARMLLATTGAEVPQSIRFRWEYGDRQGRLRGDGVARINPPDSFRLDMFTSGEGSMAVALAGDRLTSLGQIEDVELPEAPFLYAMAGVFRPGPGVRLEAGYEGDDVTTLVYDGPGGRAWTFRFERKRLVRLEDRRSGRLVQRITVEWGEQAAWPRAAEYRDLEAPRRVEWHLERASEEPKPFASGIFDLPSGG